MKDRTTFRVRPSIVMRDALWKRAKDDGLAYRHYLRDVLTAAAKEGVRFDPPAPDAHPTKETRLALTRSTKQQIQNLAKQSGRTPEEWAIEVLKQRGEG